MVVAQGLSCSKAYGIVSDQDRAHAPCIVRQIPVPCTTREAQSFQFCGDYTKDVLVLSVYIFVAF